MTGFGESQRQKNWPHISSSISSRLALAPRSLIAPCGDASAPAENERPSPRITITLTAGSRLQSPTWATSSAITSLLMALSFFGRFSTKPATREARSSRTTSGTRIRSPQAQGPNSRNANRAPPDGIASKGVLSSWMVGAPIAAATDESAVLSSP